jgi:phosphoribosylamine---glycine ligase
MASERILLYGKDARTDALAEACAGKDENHELYACGETLNPGLARRCRELFRVGSLRDVAELVELARRVRPGLAIVGPEDPLEAGLADALAREGIDCFGPLRALARIETSKAWARDLLARHKVAGVPAYRVFESTDGLREYLAGLRDFVVKPDGLTGGKGVKLTGEHLATIDEGLAYAAESIDKGGRVVVEELLRGEEFSLQSITDGETVVHCPVAQDHKRAHEGDEGPNTGGMGSYSCADGSMPFLEAAELKQAQAINEAVVAALRRETGQPYRGVLYGGFMVTRQGVRVIEYNARFGDPEALNALPLLETSFVEVARAVARGRLHELKVTFRPAATVCKYVVPEGYPERPVRDVAIEVDTAAIERLGARSYFASVDQRDGGPMKMTGSRAVALVGIASDSAEAERIAERATAAVTGPVWHRRDIGTDALLRKRIQHMQALR